MIQKKYRTKSNMVCTLVKQDIIKGVLRPGTRLLISNIAKQYDVSEIPVREAFQVLVQDGFISTKPNAGFVVSAMSQDDVRQIFEIRISLELLAARQAIQHMSNVDIDHLAQMVEDTKVYIADQAFEDYWGANRKFHLAIYKLCGNDRLFNMLNDLYGYSMRYPSYYTRVSELEKSYSTHLEMLEAFRKRDEVLVDQMTKEHTLETYHHILWRLDQEQEK